MVAGDKMRPELNGKLAASDLVQETFAAASAHFERFSGTNESEFLAWLCKILENAAGMANRRYFGTNKRDVRRELQLILDPSDARLVAVEADDTPISLRAQRDEETRLLAAAVDALSEEHRRVILLRNWERRGFTEIGQELGRSASAARKLWLRALTELERRLPKAQAVDDETEARETIDAAVESPARRQEFSRRRG
ncbi:MAG: sigma-70 family RNA polymerase sigma factor [Pirellulales bacterium]|nr:sigma-70 family RNA polymerase sigma factor [Pirellulales bacterium]